MTFKDTDSYYLGFDLSTQQLKCLAINEDLKIVNSQTVEFDRELPHYKTEKGVYIKGDVIDCPVAMWLEAVDLIFEKFNNASFPLSQVVAISGSCQQHGSVFWSKKGNDLLQELNSQNGNLVAQLSPDAFARPTAPNWQDHSTGDQCEELETLLGGPQSTTQLTGSKAHFRFTGPQILKIAEDEGEIYQNTETIQLVSNFLTSLLVGKIVPLEEADACGMNLYDITNRKFDTSLLKLIDSNGYNTSSLLEKLKGDPVKCDEPTKMGSICEYFVEKYGFNKECSIFPFTGDNLATICSLPLQNNDVLISLGTSTTVLIVTEQYHPSPNYHLFIHPTISKAYMGMICYCNGSLAREKIRDQLNVGNKDEDDWNQFDNAVMDENLDTSNELGIYFPLGEIVPSVRATTKRAIYDPKDGSIKEFIDKFQDSRHDAKNIVESQALSCRIRISPLLASLNENQVRMKNTNNQKVSFDYDHNIPMTVYSTKRPRKVFFVGGASKNDAIVKKFSQVLGATDGNYRLDTPNSCALGGCYKALWSNLYSEKKTKLNFGQFLNENFDWKEVEFVCDSDVDQWQYYNSKIAPLSHLEAAL